MKYMTTLALAIAGVTGLISPTIAATNAVNTSVPVEMVIPAISHKETIHLSHESSGAVSRLAYSPDSRYLAIVVNNTARHLVDIIVWDLQEGREQTRIRDLPIFGFPDIGILWSPDGKYLSLGRSSKEWPMQFWDPMTGRLLKELDVFGGMPSVYNRDGSKLLVNTTPLISLHPIEGSFRIYDTKSWEFKDYSSGELMIRTLTWSADNKVLTAGEWQKWSTGHSIDGITPTAADTVARLIDPAGKDPSRTVILGHGIRNPSRPDIIGAGRVSSTTSTTDAAGDVMALGSGNIMVLNTRTLDILFFYAPTSDDPKNGVMPNGFLGDSIAFSSNGKYLYIGGNSSNGANKSLVLNAQNGAQVVWFQGGLNGLAASPDGKTLALGNNESVEILTIQ